MSWLDELKEGDDVFVNTGNKIPSKVDRVTPKQIVVNGTYYNKSNGEARGVSGGKYNVDYIPFLEQVTPETKAAFLKEMRDLKKVLWVKKSISTFSNEKLIEIYDFLHKKEIV